MPSWRDGDESSDDDISMVGMEAELFETPDTVVDPSFCGPVLESEPKCMLHSMRPKKMVAFEGTLTGRRFLGCSEQVGVNCGVVQWVDAPWPEILQRCLEKLWETFHEQNLGRVNDKEAHEREVAKRKKENDMEL